MIGGERAWPVIPSPIKGGPCSLGRLSVPTPNTSLILHHRLSHRVKRGIPAYPPDCHGNVEFWSFSRRFPASLSFPGVAAGRALAPSGKLGCWRAEQPNATSNAASGLFFDVESVGRAPLQNRAAVVFLLLAQGGGCEDFAGVCCRNLSEHSESVHASLRQLKAGVFQLGRDASWDGLAKLWGGRGLSGW